MSALKLAAYTSLLLTILSSCKKNEETSLQRTDRLLKSSTWKLNKVIIDGVEQPNLYINMTIIFSQGLYTSENAEPVWPILGTWVLENERTIVRDDGAMISVHSIEKSRLVLMLHWDKSTFGGRGRSLRGDYVFELAAE